MWPLDHASLADPCKSYRQRAGLAAASESTRTVVMTPGGARFVGLDEVGTRIWTCLQEWRTVNQVADILSSEYEVSLGTLQADVFQFLTKLRKVGLVDCADANDV